MRSPPLSILAFAALSLSGANAFADECSSDADCERGYFCGCESATEPVDFDDPRSDEDDEADCERACIEHRAWEPEDECATDDDCPLGFACEAMGGWDCDAGPPCVDGEECPDPVPCEGGDGWHACVPAPIECAADSDCPAELSCVSFTYETCSGSDSPSVPPPDRGGEDAGGFDGGSDEPTPRPGAGSDFSCETVTESYCAPRWMGACTVAADCGEGFDCVEMEVCGCSGGGSSGSPDGGDRSDPPTPEEEETPSCECHSTGEMACEPVELPCEDDAACPSGWSCQFDPSTGVCWYDEESGESGCEDDPTSDEGYCVPPGWDMWGGGGHDGPVYATGEERADSDSIGGGGTGSGAPSDDDSEPTGEQGNAADPNTSTERPRANSGGGCTTATGSAPLAALAFGLLGLALARRRIA